MTKKLNVSAPSVNAGVDSNDEAKKVFGGDTFPCKKLVKNNSPKTMFFTTIKVNGSGLILRGSIQNGVHPNEAVVDFQSFDELNGFVSDVEAYADAHGYKDAVLISDIETSTPAVVETAVEPVKSSKPVAKTDNV